MYYLDILTLLSRINENPAAKELPLSLFLTPGSTQMCKDGHGTRRTDQLFPFFGYLDSYSTRRGAHYM